MNKQLVLIGMPGSGKTTIGKMVSNKLNCSFVDLDEYIREYEHFDTSLIVDDRYLKMFRNLESKCLQKINNYEVVALGGGTILVENIRKFLINKTTVYLDVPIDILEKRIGNDRPLLKICSLENLYIERKHIYENLSDVTISNINMSETVDEIIRIINSEDNYE